MMFGELREAVHRGDWGALADASLTPDQEGYVDRLVGPQMKRYRDARLILEADDPFDYEIRIRSAREAEGSLGGLLRWYACDVAEEAMRLYGNGDTRILKGIEVSRKYVLGEVGRGELKAAHKAAWDAAYAASEAAAWSAAYYAASDAAYSDAAYDAARVNVEGWFRCYLMRWVEEGAWWE